MGEIRTRVVGGPEHRISGTAPTVVPPREHEVTITVPPRRRGDVPARGSTSMSSRTMIWGHRSKFERWPQGRLRRRRAVSFVDTDILVYSTAQGAPFRDRARAVLARLAADEPLSVSWQILREAIVVMTRQQIWKSSDAHRGYYTRRHFRTALHCRRRTVFDHGPLAWDQLVQLSRRYSFAGRA